MITPRTRCRASASSARRSSGSSQSVLQIDDRLAVRRGHVLGAARDLGEERVPDVRARSGRRASPGPARSVAADPFGTQPSAAIASRTRSRVASATRSGRFTTFETVPTDTPACSATSLIVIPARSPQHHTLVAVDSIQPIWLNPFNSWLSTPTLAWARRRPAPAPLVELRGVSRSYGGVQAVAEMSFAIRSGHRARARRRERRRQVDAREDPDRDRPAGRGRARGRRRAARGSPTRRPRTGSGIVAMYQEPTVFEDLTVAENVFAGRHIRTPAAAPSTGARCARETARILGELDGRHRPRHAGPRARRRRPAAARDREGALVERAAADHGRADRRALAPRGRQPVRDRAPAARPRRRRSSTSATGSRRSRARRRRHGHPRRPPHRRRGRPPSSRRPR